MQLTRNEYIWKVCYVSQNDYHNMVDSYWTDMNKAENRAKEINGKVIQCTLFRHLDKWYHVQYTEVNVDVPSKEEVLKKLTPKERKVLGY